MTQLILELQGGGRASIEGVPYIDPSGHDADAIHELVKLTREQWQRKWPATEVRRIGLVSVAGHVQWRTELWLDLALPLFTGRSVPISRADMDLECAWSCMLLAHYPIDLEPAAARILHSIRATPVATAEEPSC